MSRVLVVDDSAAERKLIGGLLSTNPDWSIDYASDGAEALDRCQTRVPDVIVTDFTMPHMDGLQLVSKLGQRHPHIPVVLATGSGSEELAVTALQQGAASYVPKSLLARDLGRVVESVLTASHDRRSRSAVFSALVHQELRFSFPSDRRLVSAAVATLQDFAVRAGLFSERDRVRAGVALEEAFLNAIIHGNLEVSSKLRDNDDGSFEKMIAYRFGMEPYCRRRVDVHVVYSSQEARFTIRDEGPGFDVSQLPDPTDPENLARAHGRGVLLMRTFMDEVSYNDKGNEVTLVKRKVVHKPD